MVFILFNCSVPAYIFGHNLEFSLSFQKTTVVKALKREFSSHWAISPFLLHYPGFIWHANAIFLWLSPFCYRNQIASIAKSIRFSDLNRKYYQWYGSECAARTRQQPLRPCCYISDIFKWNLNAEMIFFFVPTWAIWGAHFNSLAAYFLYRL